MDPKEALELVLTIEYALLYHARPRIAWKDEAASRRAAEAVAAHLDRCSYVYTRRPPTPLHSAPWPPPGMPWPPGSPDSSG